MPLALSHPAARPMGAPHPSSTGTDDPPGLAGRTTSGLLLRRARAGDSSAVGALMARHVGPLRRWAHGRLPRWARSVADTADLVQDAVLNTLRRLHTFDPHGHAALQAYLRRAVDNRIRDEYRRIIRRGIPETVDELHPDQGPSPLEFAVAAEAEERYRASLGRMRESDRRLIVARVELGYSLEQLAFMTGRPRVDSVRVALQRAFAKLATEMDG
jgi:RNA polymerase sigma factor (sigma-70 family)